MSDSNVTLYDVAKQFIKQMDAMNPIDFNKKCCEVATSMMSNYAWMLLNRERADFTVFLNTDTSKTKVIAKELMITLRNRGLVTYIDEQPDGAWEIGIVDHRTGEAFVYYLFNYSQAIIDCGK